MASFGMYPSLKPFTRKSRPLAASGVLTLGLPLASVISPPALLIASEALTVRPSYFSNWPA